MIWGYVRGSSYWPGVIEGETPKGKYNIHFFGDYTNYDLPKSKIMHIMEGFNRMSTERNGNLNKAILEAKMFVFDQNRQTCAICEMLKLKKIINSNGETKTE